MTCAFDYAFAVVPWHRRARGPRRRSTHGFLDVQQAVLLILFIPNAQEDGIAVKTQGAAALDPVSRVEHLDAVLRRSTFERSDQTVDFGAGTKALEGITLGAGE